MASVSVGRIISESAVLSVSSLDQHLNLNLAFAAALSGLLCLLWIDWLSFLLCSEPVFDEMGWKEG